MDFLLTTYDCVFFLLHSNNHGLLIGAFIPLAKVIVNIIGLIAPIFFALVFVSIVVFHAFPAFCEFS